MAKLNKKNKQEKAISDIQKQRNDNVLRLRKVIKDKFWPFLQYQDWTIDDAQIFVQLANSFVEQETQRRVLKMKISDLNIHEHLDKTGSDYERYVKLYELIGNENVSDAAALLQGMNSAIKVHLERENKKRKFSELSEVEKEFA